MPRTVAARGARARRVRRPRGPDRRDRPRARAARRRQAAARTRARRERSRRRADDGPIQDGRALHAPVADAADELEPRPGRGRRGLLVRLPALLRIRSAARAMARAATRLREFRACPCRLESRCCSCTRGRSTRPKRSARAPRCMPSFSAKSTSAATRSTRRRSYRNSSAASTSTRRRSRPRSTRSRCRPSCSAPTS